MQKGCNSFRFNSTLLVYNVKSRIWRIWYNTYSASLAKIRVASYGGKLPLICWQVRWDFFCKAKMSRYLPVWIQCWLFWTTFNSLNRHYSLHLVYRKLQYKSRWGCGLSWRQKVRWMLGLRKAEVILIVKRSKWQVWLITECEVGASSPEWKIFV